MGAMVLGRRIGVESGGRWEKQRRFLGGLPHKEENVWVFTGGLALARKHFP
jgi:hypothetical protein